MRCGIGAPDDIEPDGEYFRGACGLEGSMLVFCNGCHQRFNRDVMLDSTLKWMW